MSRLVPTTSAPSASHVPCERESATVGNVHDNHPNSTDSKRKSTGVGSDNPLRKKMRIHDFYSIDQEDCLVVAEMLMRKNYRHCYNRIPSVAKVQKKGGEHRVCKLNLAYYYDALPLTSIGDLDALTNLNLSKLRFGSLPPSLGKLKNLKELRLEGTKNLVGLPHEIGNLSCLINLDLFNSGVQSLPCSIGRLQKLEELALSGTKNLQELPHEIGNLVSLKILYLGNSSIKSIPPSIGRLENLEELYLFQTENLSELPREIGDLTHLRKLDLCHSNITAFPVSFGRLADLMHLDISYTSMFSHSILLPLTEQLPYLGFLFEGSDNAVPELSYALACNRAKYRIGVGSTDGRGLDEMTPNLWPCMLTHARRAFAFYPQPHPTWDAWSEPFRIRKPDAIYQLLRNHLRESFLRVLINK